MAISNMNQSFTIPIPTCNGASKLPAFLQLRDDTVKIVQKYQKNWCHSFLLKYYLETQRGAVYTGKRPVEETQGQLIGFLDDYNYPEPDWVYLTYTFITQYLKYGAYKVQFYFGVNL